MNPRSRKLIVTGTLVVLMVIAVLGAALPALANTSLDAKITQVTGIAADPAKKMWWTTDESGTIQAVGADGNVTGNLTVDATMQSVQGLAFRNNRLFIADIGDPDLGRQAVDVYAVDNPTAGQQATTTKYELVYPDGAHDAAAMTVSPNGRIYVITSGDKPGIYRTSPTPQPGGVSNQLIRIGEAPAWVTDALYTANGQGLVLRTTNSVVVYSGTSFSRIGAAKLPADATGQAMALALAGAGLVAATDATPVQLVDVAVPTTVVDVGTAPSPTPATPSPTPTPSASAAPDPTASSASRSGTMWALAAAGLISLLAAAVVAFKR